MYCENEAKTEEGIHEISIVVDPLPLHALISLLRPLVANLDHCSISHPHPHADLLLRLEIIQQNASLLALLTPIPHNHTTAVDNFSRITLSIEHAQASPFSQLFSIRYFD